MNSTPRPLQTDLEFLLGTASIQGDTEKTKRWRGAGGGKVVHKVDQCFCEDSSRPLGVLATENMAEYCVCNPLLSFCVFREGSIWRAASHWPHASGPLLKKLVPLPQARVNHKFEGAGY